MEKQNSERKLKGIIDEMFNLRMDKERDDIIDANIRQNVLIKGTNLWVLIFAILIASIGLNTNSTAVIIGAMLISPLMGSIMGIGYGIGIYDFNLMRQAIKNITISMLLALVTSTIYFKMTPLSGVQSELLARTNPTIWDVSIALCGGLAGFIGITRKSSTNIIPGVAIATALMPPLCTAGYGLANLNFTYFFGALYLFFINSVFIALSSMIFTNILQLPKKHYQVDVAKRIKIYVIILVTVTTLPSIYLAYNMVSFEIYQSKVKTYINNQFNTDDTQVVQTTIKKDIIEVTIIGKTLDEKELLIARKNLNLAGLNNSKLVLHQAQQNQINIADLHLGVAGDMVKFCQEDNAKTKAEYATMSNKLLAIKNNESILSEIPEELSRLYPFMQEIYVAKGVGYFTESSEMKNYFIVSTVSLHHLSQAELEQITAWLKVRLKDNNVQLTVSYSK